MPKSIEDVTFETAGVSIAKVRHATAIDEHRDELKRVLAESICKLDRYQEKIINVPINEPLRAQANAGSGKTRVLVTRAFKMVVEDEIPPQKIVMITFTNKAAREMRDRYIQFFQDTLTEKEIEGMPLPQISTIHSFCYSLIRKRFGMWFTILSEYESLHLLRTCIQDVLGVSKFTIKETKPIFDSIRAMAANNEISCGIIPIIQVGGMTQVHLEIELPDRDKNTVLKFMQPLMKSSMFKLIQGEYPVWDDELRWSKVESYAAQGLIGEHNFVKILQRYYQTKYSSKVLDFQDMTQFILFYIANNQELVKDIWGSYSYFSQDEAQDQDVSQFATLIMCDEDTYKRYSGRVRRILLRM
jgi:superfamily I DNA/RNA helicase